MATSHHRSPLSDRPAPPIATISLSRVIDGWRREFGIDLSGIHTGTDTLVRYRCPESLLEFYPTGSPVAGPDVYAALCQLPWYYAEDKWEHSQALAILERGSRVLEIGCGSGAFLAAARDCGVQASGSDSNPAAIAAATARGLDAHLSDGCLPARDEPWDSIAAFQVLEHIPDPLPFLRSLVEHLRPGGKLVISVPDGHSPIGALPESCHLLDAPPHHQARWNACALQYLTSKLPLRTLLIAREPIRRAHIRMVAGAMLRGCDDTPWKRLMVKATREMARLCAQTTGAVQRWSGHTILAVFERTGSTA